MYQMLVFQYNLLQQQQTIYMKIFYYIIDRIILLTSSIKIFITKSINHCSYNNEALIAIQFFFCCKTGKSICFLFEVTQRKVNCYCLFVLLIALLLLLQCFTEYIVIRKLLMYQMLVFWYNLLKQQQQQQQKKRILLHHRS